MLKQRIDALLKIILNIERVRQNLPNMRSNNLKHRIPILCGGTLKKLNLETG